MFEEIFKFKTADKQKLVDYGFCNFLGGYKFKKYVCNNEFLLQVFVKNNVEVKVLDCKTNDEYLLLKLNAAGEFVGKVKAEVEAVLNDICAKCFKEEHFKTAQAKALVEFARKQFNSELEFLWKNFPTDAIWRRADTKKWFGLIMVVDKRKLGLKEDGFAETLNLRITPSDAALVDGKTILPGYHMNKKSWVSIVLDGRVATKKIFNLMRNSYILAK